MLSSAKANGGETPDMGLTITNAPSVHITNTITNTPSINHSSFSIDMVRAYNQDNVSASTFQLPTVLSGQQGYRSPIKIPELLPPLRKVRCKPVVSTCVASCELHAYCARALHACMRIYTGVPYIIYLCMQVYVKACVLKCTKRNVDIKYHDALNVTKLNYTNIMYFWLDTAGEYSISRIVNYCNLLLLYSLFKNSVIY